MPEDRQAFEVALQLDPRLSRKVFLLAQTRNHLSVQGVLEKTRTAFDLHKPLGNQLRHYVVPAQLRLCLEDVRVDTELLLEHFGSREALRVEELEQVEQVLRLRLDRRRSEQQDRIRGFHHGRRRGLRAGPGIA